MTNELKYPDRAAKCDICEGTGIATKNNGEDDFDEELCPCQLDGEDDIDDSDEVDLEK